MTPGTSDEQGLVNRGTLVAATVIGGIGAILMSIGAAVGGLSLLSSCRRWVAAMDTPPRDQARARLGQARAATSAGIDAWKASQDGERAGATRS
jgi:hypothetical protein